MNGPGVPLHSPPQVCLRIAAGGNIMQCDPRVLGAVDVATLAGVVRRSNVPVNDVSITLDTVEQRLWLPASLDDVSAAIEQAYTLGAMR